MNYKKSRTFKYPHIHKFSTNNPFPSYISIILEPNPTFLLICKNHISFNLIYCLLLQGEEKYPSSERKKA